MTLWWSVNYGTVLHSLTQVLTLVQSPKSSIVSSAVHCLLRQDTSNCSLSEQFTKTSTKERKFLRVPCKWPLVVRYVAKSCSVLPFVFNTSPVWNTPALRKRTLLNASPTLPNAPHHNPLLFTVLLRGISTLRTSAEAQQQSSRSEKVSPLAGESQDVTGWSRENTNDSQNESPSSCSERHPVSL